MTTLPIADVHYGIRPSVSGFLTNLIAASPIASALNPTAVSAAVREGLEDLSIAASRARKPAEGTLSFLDRVREFIHFNAPKAPLSSIMSTLSHAKMPILVSLGVAAAGGLAYLAYKVYQNRDEIPSAINKIMEDIRETVPDLVQVQGWAQSIRNEVTSIVDKFADAPSKLISKIAELKATVMNHQSTINPENMGGGVNMITSFGKPQRSGQGIKVAMN